MQGKQSVGRSLINVNYTASMPSSPDRSPVSAARLRSEAEERLRHQEENLSRLSPDELKNAIHELHVHQIELEMRNEQLRLVQSDLETARERYVELFDFAP